jgi:hypothetical protein
MKILLAEKSDPTNYDVQLLKFSTSPLNFDLIPQSVHPSEGDMLI